MRLFVFAACIALASPSFGQNQPSAWKRGTAIVLFSGVGGGILGLSTLSFYGKPEEHTSNITIGAVAGLIAGASYLAWEGSQRPTEQSWSVIPHGEGAVVAYRVPF